MPNGVGSALEILLQWIAEEQAKGLLDLRIELLPGAKEYYEDIFIRCGAGVSRNEIARGILDFNRAIGSAQPWEELPKEG